MSSPLLQHRDKRLSEAYHKTLTDRAERLGARAQAEFQGDAEGEGVEVVREERSEAGPSRTKATRSKAEPYTIRAAPTNGKGEDKATTLTTRRHSFELVIPVRPKRVVKGKGKASEVQEDKAEEEEEVVEAMGVDEPDQDAPVATPATPPASVTDAIRMSIPPITPTSTVLSPPHIKVPLAYSQSFGVSSMSKFNDSR